MPEGGFAEACGAFMLSSAAIVLTGWIKPLRQWVERIPLSLSSAMLAGVLINICLIPVTSLVEAPCVIGPVVLVWFLVSLVSSLWAVPAAVVAFDGHGGGRRLAELAGSSSCSGMDLANHFLK